VNPLDLLGRVYGAAGEAAGWTPALEGLSELLRTPVLALRVRSTARGDREVWQVGNTLPPGFVRLSLRIGACEPPDAILEGGRPARAGDYGTDELDLLEKIGPHIATAIRLRRRLLEAERERTAACGALDRLPLGVILVDESGRVLLVNPRAREIVAHGDGLLAVRGELRADRSQDSGLLRAAFSHAARARGAGAGERAFLALQRVSGKRPYAVALAPVASPDASMSGRGVVALFVSDPEEGAAIDPVALEQLYDLTPTEAKIVASLSAGHSPEEAADRLQMRLSTLRFHLKHVFAKTGTNRQASLVGLVLDGPASVRRV
jgi:DNA-binding CsgD family transcriptional regulator